ncbi:MAG: hypothetical protein ACRD3M_04740 [Thermoanaerobaculia bacterium]
MPLDASAVFFYTSLGISAAAVVLFLWLIREPRGRETEDGRRKTNENTGRDRNE